MASDWRFTWHGLKLLYPNQKCTGNHETCAHHIESVGNSIDSLVVTVQPACLHLNWGQQWWSIVYLGDDLKSASLQRPWFSSAERSSVYVPVDSYQSVYVNVQMFLFVCLFVCMSFWVLQTKRRSVELSSIDICSSSSSEQLHSSVLAPARPTASRIFTLTHVSTRGQHVLSASQLSLM